MILAGIDDDGTVVGIDEPRKVESRIREWIEEWCEPPSEV